MKIEPLKRRYRLYLNGDYFHGGYDKIEEAALDAVKIEKRFLPSQIEELGGNLEWTVEDIEDREVYDILS